MEFDEISLLSRNEAVSARRRPLMKGDSTESSNPFFDDEEQACSSEDEDRRPQEDHGGKSASHAQVSAKDEDIILPEWLVELPEELEVGLFFFYIRKCVYLPRL